MKRRKFLIDSIGIVSGLAVTGRALASDPCNPQLSGANVVPCPAGDSALSLAAQGLSMGESVDFTKNTRQREFDIQWMTKPLYYDPGRKELQYVGRPASSQDSAWKHYVYDEASDAWTDKGTVATGAGHNWLNTMDPRTGDYYWNDGSGGDVIYKFTRSTNSWSTISFSNTQIGVLAYHPNLFGSGDPGIFVWEGESYYCYRLSDGSMHNVGPTEGSGGISGRTSRCRNGTGDYVAVRDSVVCGSKGWETNSNRWPIIEVHAGAGNSSDATAEGTIVYRSQAPAMIFGAGAGQRHGKLVAHPSDAGRALICEGYGNDRVWESSNGGASWIQKGYTHPFGNMNGWVDHWMLGRISEYGVIIGMSSGGNGGRTILWKPND